MVVLVVEDDNYKFDRVLRTLTDCGLAAEAVVRKKTSIDAFKWLQSHQCDVLVLDFCLPRRNDDTPSIDVGPLLLENVFRSDSGCCIPSRIIALTAFKNDAEQFEDQFEKEGIVVVPYSNEEKDWETTLSRIVLRRKGDMRIRSSGLIIPLHGIRTLGSWHRTLADVAFLESWSCPVDGWWYGKFSVFGFLSPAARHVKVQWFRERYSQTIRENSHLMGPSDRPSVIAHSFGTFMVGNALLKFKDIRVDKVVLCGSILPVDFPWDKLIENGQVGSVLNCVGKDDIWPRISAFLVPGTGKSGAAGFRTKHPLLHQQFYNLSHSEFFDREQMRKEWFSFLKTPVDVLARTKSPTRVRRAAGDHPWLSLVLGPAVWIFLATVACIAFYVVALVYVLVVDAALSNIQDWL